MKNPSTWKMVFLLTTAALTFFVLSQECHAASDSLSPGESISAGDNKGTLVSKGEIFALGFFNPGRKSSRWYLGIWYKNLPGRTVVWVANREAPVGGTTGVLTLTEDGRLVVSDGKIELWSTATKNISSSSTPTARLMDDGNLVVVDANGVYYWQSFEHPTDTLLPGMKIGVNLRTGESTNLTSWRTADDPSPGNYTAAIDVSGVPQVMLYENLKPVWRIGHWTGESWSNLPVTFFLKGVLKFNHSTTDDEVSFVLEILVEGMLASLSLSQNAPKVIPRAWVLGNWKTFPSLGPSDACDYYRRCGANSVCRGNTELSCSCLSGFGTDGNKNGLLERGGEECTRKFQVDCQEGTNELKEVSGKKFPDTTEAAVFESISDLEGCKAACLKNCSCTACASATFNGTGCIMWFGDLYDIGEDSVAPRNFYVRLGTVGPATETFWKKTIGIVIIVVVTLAGTLLLGFVSCCLLRRKKKIIENHHSVQCDAEDLDLPILDFDTIQNSTNNFSSENKIGEGGFGPVYKGTLENGQLIAVKRLSQLSAQGLIQFKNEINLIAKLQHRNLVKLLGCCIHNEERMLIYEYMPKKSLDHFLFSESKGELHDWQTRYKIIIGIARGLLYLHHDSRLRIIHRDLKAANVLLDNDMNPKVSDFGTARIFEGCDTEDTNTRRVVGTYGYMSPEYAVNGIFSMKSDVFSFGILLLEIISGIKSKSNFFTDPQKSLVGLAWKLWNSRNAVEFIDESITPPFPEEEIVKCIKIGLLCVQEEPGDRPLMSSILLMLDGVETIMEPKEPNYVDTRVPFTLTISPSRNEESYGANVMSITMQEGR